MYFKDIWILTAQLSLEMIPGTLYSYNQVDSKMSSESSPGPSFC